MYLSGLISAHLLFFKNSCQTQLCTKFIHIIIDTIKFYGDKLKITITVSAVIKRNYVFSSKIAASNEHFAVK